MTKSTRLKTFTETLNALNNLDKTASLEEIYQEIDKLEKSKIEVTEYKKKSEKFWPFALVAAGLLLIEFLLRNIIFKGIV